MTTPGLQTGNLLTLQEQSFETAGATGWVSLTNATEVERRTDRAFDGVACLHFMGTATGVSSVRLNRTISCTAGQTLRLSARMFGWLEGGTAVRLRCRWFNGGTLSSTSGAIGETTMTSWGLIDGVITVPAGINGFQPVIERTLIRAWEQTWVDAVFSAVHSPPQVTTASLPPATQNQPYTAPLAASGGTPPYTFSATGLPPGIAVSGPVIPVGGAAQYAGALLGNWNGQALYNWPHTTGGADNHGGGTYSVNADGDLVLGTNGTHGNSAKIEHPFPGVIHGVIEARIHWPDNGSNRIPCFPAFWICGNNWPTDGECDIAEGVAYGMLSSHFHWGPVTYPNHGATLQSWHSGDNPDLRPGWHVHSVVWTATMCRIFNNGVLWHTFTVPPVNAAGMTGPMRIIINITTSNTNGWTRMPAQLRVNYVRRWAIA